MQNKKFIILISVAAIIIISVFGALFYYSFKNTPTGETPPGAVELTDFGLTPFPGGQPEPAPTTPPAQPETVPTSPAPAATLSLKQVSNLPVVGAVAYEKERLIEGLAPLSFSFEVDLKQGDDNKDVRSLQIFLNSIADILNPSDPSVGPIAASGSGSPGKEGTYFGLATKEALIRFQNKYPDEILVPAGLTAGDGVFAGLTRQKINSLLASAPENLIVKLTGPRNQTETATVLRYVDQLSGNIYETFIDRLEERRISSAQIFGIHEAMFANKGQSVILRYLKDDGKTIETFVGKIVDDQSDLKGSFLPENVLSLSVSPDGNNIFYIFRSGAGVVGINSSIEGGKNSQIFDSSFSEWMAEWGNSRQISLATKPSFASAGFLYSLDPSNGAFNKILGNITGLTAKISPDGRSVLYADDNLDLRIYNISSKTSFDSGLKTMPEKCVWSKDSSRIYCAVPQFIPNDDYPDAWYQGTVSFSDSIWRINIDTNSGNILIDPGQAIGKIIDGTKLFLDDREDNLFFINKKDSILWSLDVRI